MEEDLVSSFPELEEYIAKLDFIVVLAVNHNKTTNFANIVLPAAAYAEKNGTWVNYANRIQRIRPAVAVSDADRSLDGMAMSRLDKFGTEYDRWGKAIKIDARPSWKIISGLLKAFGHKTKFAMAEEVFADMAEHIPALRDVDYDVIGERGFQLQNVTVVHS